ncbi:mucin-5AC-like isoform X2 [Xiphias gladius]|uniref:mucin-5AC-like isoform X2 n=1 Tax=Xiphias gladius TaxID=8245 RepID=UPI001A994A1B|nr:mucin-5AC-like isoform X2 [Xiphias gladius]
MPPSLLLLLLLLLVCSSQAHHFYGTVITYYPKNTNTDGSVKVVLRYKLNFHRCREIDSWDCLSGDCGSQGSVMLNQVDGDSREECQTEGIETRQVPSDASFQLVLDGGRWINNRNGITSWRAVTLVELKSRSDTGKANTSPQTTFLPAVRVPSNCQRDFNLLAFDPDGDEVKCRYGSTSHTSQKECNPCTPPSVLTLSSSCTLSFSATSTSDQGLYAVQLVMEDFPRRTITLTQTNGVETTITTNDAISKIPVQFVLLVDPVVSSCAEGLYLPEFLPPTPANRARLYTSVSQSLEINISAQASNSTISELLFSGPYNIHHTTVAAGRHILTWTPYPNEDGESHPICFVVQAVSNSTIYQSELRCVIVTVGPDPTTATPTTTTAASTTTTPLTTTTVETTTTAPTSSSQPTTIISAVPTTTTPQTTTSPPMTTTAALTTANTDGATTVLSTTTITTTSTTTAPSTTTPATATSPSAASPTPVINVLNKVIVGLRMKISSSSPLSEDYVRNTVIPQFCLFVPR